MYVRFVSSHNPYKSNSFILVLHFTAQQFAVKQPIDESTSCSSTDNWTDSAVLLWGFRCDLSCFACWDTWQQPDWGNDPKAVNNPNQPGRMLNLTVHRELSWICWFSHTNCWLANNFQFCFVWSRISSFPAISYLLEGHILSFTLISFHHVFCF